MTRQPAAGPSLIAPVRRVPALLAATALVGSGCSVLGGSPAEDVADRLAESLSTHSLDGVPPTRDSAKARFARLIEPLDEERVEVTVKEVTEDGETAEATLAWEWQLPGGVWRYTTTADLVDDGARWELDWQPSLVEPSLADDDRLGLFTVPAPRGRILGLGGTALVQERPVVRYGLDMTKIKAASAAASAQRIADVLEIDRASYEARVDAAGPEAFVEALVLRTEDARQVDPAYSAIPGAVTLDDQIPLAPTSEFARELLGTVGPATAEIIAESDGQVEVGDVLGTSGLQARYDAMLTGSPGVAVVAVGRDEQRRALHRGEPVAGQDLRTTIDGELQLKAEQVLAAVGENGPRAAIVVVRPSDGHILAAANGPGNEGLNIATAGQYAPGSTFKVVTALALLRAGMEPDDLMSCPTTTLVDGRSFKNYDDYPASGVGTISFTAALANSCNTALINERERLSDHDLTQAAEALGLGRDVDLGFPSYFGQVPAPEGETEKAADLIGQGKVLASPLTMASVAASIRSGRAVVPLLLPDYGLERPEPDRPLTAQESATLQEMMRAVVTQGSGRFLLDLPGELGAKTGTAEYGEPDPNGQLQTHAWMIAQREDMAISVFVETGQSGSTTAGPLLEALLS